jgi:predicted ATP-grasp superfamily ATP-dependent carboligase
VTAGNGTIGQALKPKKPSDLITKARAADPKSWQNYMIGSFGEQAQFIQHFYAGSHSSYSVNQGMNDLKNLSLNEELVMTDENFQVLRRAYKEMLAVDAHTVGMYKKSNGKFRQSPEGQIFNDLVI